MANFYHLSIKNITKETHNSVSIEFTVPESLKNNFVFTPGQYITIQKALNGAQVRRDYSICCAQNSGKLKIGIKAVENGLFSQYATKELKVGDELEISEPRGRFLLATDASHQKNYLAFAAGSGITPILSMVKSALAIEPNSKFVLVFGNKTQEDIMFKKDLEVLQSQYADRFFLHYVFSKASYENHFSGRITKAVVNSVVKDLHAGTRFDASYLCGPEAMIHEVKDTLLENNFSENTVHFELFTVATEENNETVAEESLDGEATITVLLDDDEETFTMPKDKTILERALLQGLDAPYSCQGGICSSCLAKVTEGKAVMQKNAILDDDEVAEGLILTCQAHPVTNTIKVDFDDV